MVDSNTVLPWLHAPLQDALRSQRAHALLIHGPQGIGQFELGLGLAHAWLCEAAQGNRPACGVCAGCRLLQARTHPDLLVLVPDALRLSMGWSVGEDDNAESAGSKAKPSKEIKVDAVRAAVDFAQSTSARGRGKVVVIHPAERMNAIAANTLLKTLEEPPGAARFVLSCGASDALLPTIRSRCQAVRLNLPPADVACAWLAQQGVAQPEVLLAAAGGQPLLALAWSREQLDAVAWARLPKQLAAGEVGTLATWPLPRLLDALHKLCHDAACMTCGAAPRYFAPAALPQGAALPALLAWGRALNQTLRHAEHAWNLPLMVESLVLQARLALAPPATAKSRSVHSAR